MMSPKNLSAPIRQIREIRVPFECKNSTRISGIDHFTIFSMISFCQGSHDFDL
jgi:hypothetical protein